MIKFFKTQEAFSKWLGKNHQKVDELFVGFFKVHTKKGVANSLINFTIENAKEFE